MRIKYSIAKGTYELARLEINLTKEAKLRLNWFDYYEEHRRNARLTCRHFGISPQTFYRWLKRYDPHHPITLESQSHRPKKVRQPTYTLEQIEAVRKMREKYPRWGKDKIAVLLKRENYPISVSMVGRILTYLKGRNILREPVLNRISSRKRVYIRPYAIRKPKEYQPKLPGDLVELDTLDVRPLPGVIYKHFSSYDVIGRWNVLGLYTRATAKTASRFLDDLEKRTPHKIKSLQIDGGSEFQSFFELECQRRGIQLFVLPPRSPKLNGAVERANRTHTEEFYEVTDSTFDLADLRSKLLEWEYICNNIRPNQALNYLTPAEYLLQFSKEVRCH
jgi:transposase InsO family protein